MYVQTTINSVPGDIFFKRMTLKSYNYETILVLFFVFVFALFFSFFIVFLFVCLFVLTENYAMVGPSPKNQNIPS